MYVAHHATAEAAGARIVHACGFDSIPHDLGAYFTVQQLAADGSGDDARRGPRRGSFSGGTFHSALGAFSRRPADARRDAGPPQGRAAPRGPLVQGGRRQAAPRQGARLLAAAAADDRPARRRPQRRRAARRTARDFSYSHYAGIKTLRYAAGGVAGAGALAVAAQIPPLRKFAARAGSSRATARTRRAARSRGSPSTSSARATAARSAPRSPAATRATTRPPRCSPSRRCAWPSTTTRPPPAGHHRPGDGRQPAGAPGRGRDHVPGEVTAAQSAQRDEDADGEAGRQQPHDGVEPGAHAGTFPVRDGHGHGR